MSSHEQEAACRALRALPSPADWAAVFAAQSEEMRKIAQQLPRAWQDTDKSRAWRRLIDLLASVSASLSAS